jgi:protein TonB
MEEEPDGVFVVELAPDTTTLRAIAHEMRPGPESEESAEVQPTVERKHTIDDMEQPYLPLVREVPQELALPAKSTDTTAEREDAEKQHDVPQQRQVAASKASIAARPVSVEGAVVAAKTAAPMAGLAERDGRSRAKWQRELVAYLSRFKSYPAGARDRRETGDIQLRFRLDRSGRVTAVEVVRSSGFPRLDEAAVDMVRRASPLPVPPAEVPGESIELVVPVQFHIKG